MPLWTNRYNGGSPVDLDAYATGSALKNCGVISGYDMNMDNLTTNDLVQGKYGKCFQFDNARKTLLKRVHGTNDLLPIYKYPAFTLSIWVNGAPNQSDRRIFCESSSSANNPLFDLGTHFLVWVAASGCSPHATGSPDGQPMVRVQ